jgi:hypothetical protein
MAFLDKAAKHPFAWGDHDCMLEVADWLDAACGMDIASAWRGLYDDEDSLTATLDALGGFETAMRAAAAQHGLAEVAEPQFGDVGIVQPPGQPKPLGAILMPSGRWRMKTLTGIALRRDVTVVVAWSLPCRPSLLQL